MTPPAPPGEAETLSSIERDDAYSVTRVLADHPSGLTELVMCGSAGPYVRKRIPLELANVAAWEEVSAIEEPRLPRVIETYRLPDAFVVVCDYVPGASLAEWVGQRRRLAPAEAVGILADVCQAAGELHRHGIVHRDITPSNVILAPDGAHLIDLGIARVHEDGARHDTVQLGTMGFSAPEQFGFAQTDARSDVYSLGCLLAFMLTGRHVGEQGFERGMADSAQVPRPLAQVIERACDLEPSARYQTAESLAAAAKEALDPGKALPVPAAQDRQEARPTTRQKAVAWAIGVIAAAWGAIFAVAGVSPNNPELTASGVVMYRLFATVLVVAWCAIPGIELCQASLRRGGYSADEHPWAHALRRTAIVAGVGLLTMCVVVLFCQEVLGPTS